MIVFAYIILFLWWVVATLTMPGWLIVFIFGLAINEADWQDMKRFTKAYYMLEFIDF